MREGSWNLWLLVGDGEMIFLLMIIDLSETRYSVIL